MKITYEQAYAAELDMTVIVRIIHNDEGDIYEESITGYYHGEPDLEGLKTFMNSGTTAKFS